MQNTLTDGIVVENLPDATFRVKLASENQPELLCYLAGKLKLSRVKLLPGDRVKVETSPYDTTRGRIVFKSK